MLIDAPTNPPALIPETELRETTNPKKITDADVIRHAKTVLDQRGWTRSSWQDEHGRVCLLGAIGVASIELRGSPFRNLSSRVQVHSASRNIVGVRDEYYLTGWNDRIEVFFRRSAHKKVKARLDELAARADRNGGCYPRS